MIKLKLLYRISTNYSYSNECSRSSKKCVDINNFKMMASLLNLVDVTKIVNHFSNFSKLQLL